MTLGPSGYGQPPPRGYGRPDGGFGMPGMGGAAAMSPNSGGRMDVPGGRGATSVPGGGLPGQGFSGWTRGFGGGGGATTPNSPPPVNQLPTMNTPTGGMPPAGGPPSGFGQGPGVVYPNAGSDAARQKTYQSNTGGINMPGSPTTPNIPNQSQPFDVFDFSGTGGGTGGGYQPPTRGTGPITNKNTWNIAGDTSVTEGDKLAQKMPKKTFKQPKVAMGQKEIGDPRLAMQQLSAMQQTPFMRRA